MTHQGKAVSDDMKISWKAALILILAILCHPLIASADGREMTFMLTDGKTMKGELLSVRTGSFMVALHPGRSESELRQFPDAVVEIPFEKVGAVEISGRSNVLIWTALGLIGGAMVGGALGSADANDSDHNLGEAFAEPFSIMAGAMVGGLIGMGVGAVVGLSTSTSDQTIDTAGAMNLEYFRQHARYRNGEPDFLSGIPQ